MVEYIIIGLVIAGLAAIIIRRRKSGGSTGTGSGTPGSTKPREDQQHR